MKWFEPIIASFAAFLVVLPLILNIINKKRGKHNCSCGCQDCSKRNECYSALKDYINSEDFKNDMKRINEEL